MNQRLFALSILALYMINAFAIVVTKPLFPLIVEIGCFTILSFFVGGILSDGVHPINKGHWEYSLDGTHWFQDERSPKEQRANPFDSRGYDFIRFRQKGETIPQITIEYLREGQEPTPPDPNS